MKLNRVFIFLICVVICSVLRFGNRSSKSLSVRALPPPDIDSPLYSRCRIIAEFFFFNMIFLFILYFGNSQSRKLKPTNPPFAL